MAIDYDSLIDRPRINGHILTGDMSSEDLDIQGGSGNVDDVLVNGQSVVDEFKIAKIKSYKEVTQAEYNALPASKTEDNVMYCITDAHGADGYPPLIYSDEEREVGVWRDGKPLYQKVFNLNNAEIQVDTFYEIPNTDKTQYDTYVYCYLIDSSGQAWCATAGYSGNYVAVVVHSNRTRNYQYAIIQYTKTTDTAGSGTWTTQGAYAHHYSTDEHVVGTWIDGKPIYEKTWDLGQNITVGSWTTVMSVAGVNIDKIVNSISVQNDPAVSFIEYWVDGTTLKGNSLRYGENDYVRYLTLQYTKTTD